MLVRQFAHRALGAIGYAMLGIVIEKMQLPMWVQRNVDTTSLQNPLRPPSVK